MGRCVWVAVLALLAMARLDAITVLPMGFADLVHESASVVYARVADVHGQWTDDRRAIESVVTVDVMSAFKGTGAERLRFAVPGGQVGQYINLIPGAPRFAPGDLVVVFLTTRGARMPMPTGFTQGVYRVMSDARTGAMVVVPPPVSAAGAGPIVRGDPTRPALPIAAFAAAVRAAEVERR